MKSLKKLLNYFYLLLKGKIIVNDSELVSRALSENEIKTNKDNTYVMRPGALNLGANRKEWSVYRLFNFTEHDSIWNLLDKYVGEERKEVFKNGKVLYVGVAKVESIKKNKLGVKIYPHPHYRHADIVGWPIFDTSPEQLAKKTDFRLEVATCFQVNKRTTS